MKPVFLKIEDAIECINSWMEMVFDTETVYSLFDEAEMYDGRSCYVVNLERLHEIIDANIELVIEDDKIVQPKGKLIKNDTNY